MENIIANKNKIISSLILKSGNKGFIDRKISAMQKSQLINQLIKTMVLISGLIFIFLNHAVAQDKLSANEAMMRLKGGNERFVTGKQLFANLDKKRMKETSEHGQHPYVTVLTCSDSRVPVEYIFDAGIGDIFVIRVAGNVVNTDEAGSIEYGTEHLHTPLLVILGHSNCGAVTAVAKDAETEGNIPKLTKNIEPAVKKAKDKLGQTFSEEMLNESVKNNVYQSIEDLLKISPVVGEQVKAKELLIVGAIYHIESGTVEWLGEHPDQSEFISH